MPPSRSPSRSRSRSRTRSRTRSRSKPPNKIHEFVRSIHHDELAKKLPEKETNANILKRIFAHMLTLPQTAIEGMCKYLPATSALANTYVAGNIAYLMYQNAAMLEVLKYVMLSGDVKNVIFYNYVMYWLVWLGCQSYESMKSVIDLARATGRLFLR